jgi:branched-chain amino acid transport system permease protein
MSNFGFLFQQLANAVPLAALYAALAAAYALPFGLHRRADFSFGALHAFAGQMLVLMAALGWNVLWLNLPSSLAFGASAALALTVCFTWLIGRKVIQPLAEQTPNTMLAATLGVMIVLMELARITSNTRSQWLPPFLNAPVEVLPGASLTIIQLINTALFICLALAAHSLITRTRFGRSWKAVRDDPKAAALCGVNAQSTLRKAHLAGAALAAIAGVLNTAWLGNMDFNASLVYGLKIVFIAAIGGVLSPGAAALGGAGLAVAETVWAAFAPLIWRDVFVFVVLIFVMTMHRQHNESMPSGSRD